MSLRLGQRDFWLIYMTTVCSLNILAPLPNHSYSAIPPALTENLFTPTASSDLIPLNILPSLKTLESPNRIIEIPLIRHEQIVAPRILQSNRIRASKVAAYGVPTAHVNQHGCRISGAE